MREKQQAYLHEIIEQLNTLFGNDMTDGDLFSYGTAVGTKTLESKKLQQQAHSNSKEQFGNSPDLNIEMLDAVIESMDAQEELSKRTLNSAEVREGLKRWLLDHFQLYEKLRHRAEIA